MENDFISREAVLETLTQQFNDIAVSQVQKYTIERSKERISAIPSSDVAPLHRGEWVEFDGEGTYQCTYCGEPFILIEGTPRDNEYNYCPKCGACLREGLGGDRQEEESANV